MSIPRDLYGLKEDVRGRLYDAEDLGFSQRERAAHRIALNSLESATAACSPDLNAELEHELEDCEWQYPHLTARARQIIAELESGE